ncbi:hypothetical protein KY285_008089 [Solanum tuberosum]|nr:hypothetical protein KY289_008504 [Solanum tuberosum]KAH0746432.1 hypothetical protein KY285_008089 [Solanum tuberosum]
MPSDKDIMGKNVQLDGNPKKYSRLEITEIAWISEIAKEKARGDEIKTSVFVIIVYIIWRERNKIRF